MRAERSSSEVKTTARPSFSNSFGSAAERLKIAPFGASEPNSATSPPFGCSGSIERFDDGAVDRTVRRGKPFRQGFAGDRHAIEVQQRFQLAQHRADAAGGEQILHVVRAGRFQIDQNRRRLADLVEPAEIEVDAGPSRDRGQMQYRIGRAADRHQHPQRILDRIRRHDPIGRQPGPRRAASRRGRSLRRRAAGRHGPPGSPRCRAGSCRAPRRSRPSCSRFP